MTRINRKMVRGAWTRLVLDILHFTFTSALQQVQRLMPLMCTLRNSQHLIIHSSDVWLHVHISFTADACRFWCQQMEIKHKRDSTDPPDICSHLSLPHSLLKKWHSQTDLTHFTRDILVSWGGHVKAMMKYSSWTSRFEEYWEKTFLVWVERSINADNSRRHFQRKPAPRQTLQHSRRSTQHSVCHIFTTFTFCRCPLESAPKPWTNRQRVKKKNTEGFVERWSVCGGTGGALTGEREPGDGVKEGMTLDVAHASSSRAQTITCVKLKQLQGHKQKIKATIRWSIYHNNNKKNSVTEPEH